MDVTSKRDLALSFLNDLANMRRERLQEIIQTIVGEELAAAMFNYARQIIEADPEKALDNASTLMILGYLIHVHEQGGIHEDTLPA